MVKKNRVGEHTQPIKINSLFYDFKIGGPGKYGYSTCGWATIGEQLIISIWMTSRLCPLILLYYLIIKNT